MKIVVKLDGGLGNQMFQIANGLSVSYRYDSKLYIHKTIKGNSHLCSHANSYMQTIFYFLKDFITDDVCEVYMEKCVDYEAIDITGDSMLCGFFQSEKYFKKNASRIKTLFSQWWAKTNIAKTILNLNINYDSSICLHVRRGDYCKLDHHPVLPIKYYNKAVEYICKKENRALSDYTIYVFSDDLEWCKKIFSSTCVFVNNTPEIDLYFISTFQRIIIANSSFSWWGAYLSKAHIIIRPDEYPIDRKMGDYYVESWTTITTK